MEIEQLKTSRSTKKRKVTLLIGKLKASLQYGDSNYPVIKSSLEEEFEALKDLDLHISEIENIDSNYLDSITPSYENVMKMFYDSRKEDGKIESTYGNSSRPTGMWKNEKRTREIEQREKSNWKATVKKWEKENFR